MVESGSLSLHLSLTIIEELEGVLKRARFKRRVNELGIGSDDILNTLLSLSEIYDVDDTVFLIDEDPEDNKFLACAFAAGAKYLISGDKHLLNVKNFRGIRIMSPQDFLKEIKTSCFKFCI